MVTSKKVGRKLVARKSKTFLFLSKYVALPILLLEGRQLENAGFSPGDRVQIEFLNNQIVIRKEVANA